MARFIIWDHRRDGEPRTDDQGNITSDGLIGRIDDGNVYIRGYAVYAEGTVLENGVPVLNVGGFVVATFSLSGTKGTYRIYRVE